MPLLPDLPNELLAPIMRYLHPDDVDSFSKSCKDFHEISTRILPKHAHLKKKYLRVFCGFTHNLRLHHPLVLFRDIVENPEVVWYVKEMYIGACDYLYPHWDKERWEEAEQIAVQCKEGIVATVQACLYLNDEERGYWTKVALSGHQNTAVALLACVFPCLEQITISGNRFNEQLHFLVRRILEAEKLNPGGSHALSKLEMFQEGNNTAQAFQDIISFNPLSSLPISFEPYSSLRSMRRYMGRHLYNEFEWTSAEKQSRIESLDFNNCVINTKTLRNIFGSIANLKHFTYEHYWCDHLKSCWEPEEIILSLLEFAAPSLAELNLTRSSGVEAQGVEKVRRRMEENLEFGENPTNFNPFIGSLRGFQVLKYIRIQYEAFVEGGRGSSEDGRTVHRIVDILPASVERVVLAKPRLPDTVTRRIMDLLPEFKAERLPRLKQIVFENGKDHKEMETVIMDGDTQLLM